jgi:SAM-dependent methyltransferase
MITVLLCYLALVADPRPEVLFTATPDDVVEKALDAVSLTKEDTVYDLGCGDGRVLIRAAQRAGCKGYGVDVDDELLQRAQAAIVKARLGHLVRVEKKDMYATDLRQASVVYLYVLPSMLTRLKPQLAQLRPGSRVISHEFPIKGYKPDRVIKYQATDGYDHMLYVWTTPFKRDEP